MARGWESKSVEEQQAESSADRKQRAPVPTPSQLARQKQREGLLLARTHLQQQMEKAHNLHHRNVLEAAMADIQAKLASLS